MPTTYTNNAFFFDPGELFVAAAPYAADTLIGLFTGSTFEWSIGAVGGDPCITRTESRTSGDTAIINLILIGLAGASAAPEAFVLGSEGASLTARSQVGTIVEVTLSDKITAIQDYVENAFIPFILGLTGISTNIEAVTATEDEDYNIATVAVVMTAIGSAGRVFTPVVACTFYGNVSSEEDPNESGSLGGLAPTQAARLALGGASPDIARIAGSLEEIANQETDVSINNNAAIFSAKSKVITGP